MAMHRASTQMQRRAAAARVTHAAPHIHQPLGATRTTSRVRRTAMAKAAAVDFPMDLPLFPVQPKGCFTPGMTKTLHLYEPHFLALIEEAQEHPSRLMCIAVMEPYMGDPQQAASLGSYIGGSNCVFSCACLVKVLNVRPYMKGYLVQIRGEARLGINSVLQTDPYIRAKVYSLPDPVPTRREMESLPQAVDQLDTVMREVQMLASKFRCDETASIQQAFRYVNEQPLVPNIQEPLPTLPLSADTAGTAATAHTADGMQQYSGQLDGADQNVSHIVLHPPPAPQAATSSHSSDKHAHDTTQAASSTQGASTSAESLQTQHTGRPGAAGSAQSVGQGHQAQGALVTEEQEEPFDLQRASRLSYASLQWLPQSTMEERYMVIQGRLMAMEAASLSDRLTIVTPIMDAARASLAAKCALQALS